MSVKVVGYIDMPELDLRKVADIYEITIFLLENDILPFLNEYDIVVDENSIKFTHKRRNWSYFIIRSDGTIEYDKHYERTVLDKDELLKAIRTYFPMFKKAKEILAKLNSKGKTYYDEKEECIVIEMDE